MNNGKMWCMLIHLGTNMWYEEGNTRGDGDLIWKSPASDSLRFDREVFYRYLDALKEQGANTVVLDIAEGMRYESHPELAVEGSYTHDEMREMLEYMRSLGFEVIPKLNFSTCHDYWLGEYARMVSTPKYYEVCRDLINEVCALFEPRFFHLGMDEENYDNQKNYDHIVIRNNDLWWHDLYFLIDCVEKNGARAMMWSDYARHRPDEFLAKIPRSVVQCNWYYSLKYGEEMDEACFIRVRPFGLFAKAGIDQLPGGSTEYFRDNLEKMAEYIRDNIPTDHILGFLETTWRGTLKSREDTLIDSAAALGDAKRAFEAR